MRPVGKYNQIQVGLAFGLLAPPIGFLAIYLAGFRGTGPIEFIDLLVSTKKLSSIISLSVIPNLLLFFIFIWLNYLYSARGVLASTLFYAGIVVVTKFLI
jgi:hypothetical protein